MTLLEKNIRKNSIWLLLARVTAQVLAIVFTAIIARKLGVDNFGHFALIASLLLIGNTFTNFGTDTFLIREISRADQPTEIVQQSLSLQLVLSALYCIIMLAYRDTPLLLYSLALFPLAIFSVNNALLRALNRMDLFMLLSLVNGFFHFSSAIFSSDVWSLCIFLLIGQILLSIFSYLICRASLWTFGLLPLKNFFPILKLILPFAALTILLVLTQRLGILSVSTLLDDAATGLFSSITRIVDGLKFGHYAILGALLPAISRGTADSWKSFRKAFTLLFSVSTTFALLLMIFGKSIVFILYGAEFAQASTQLALLGWSLLPYTVSSFVSYNLIARKHESDVVIASFISLVIYVVLYLWLIPSNGLIGAVRAALFGECMQAIVFGIFYAARYAKREEAPSYSE